MLNFTIINSNLHGRCGILKTAHGYVKTPNFIFCATKGAIKGATNSQLNELNTQMILSNTFHLMQHSEDIKKWEDYINLWVGTNHY